MLFACWKYFPFYSGSGPAAQAARQALKQAGRESSWKTQSMLVGRIMEKYIFKFCLVAFEYWALSMSVTNFL